MTRSEPARVLKLRGFEQSLTQYEKNLNTALPAFEQADIANVDSVIDRLARAEELALAMAAMTATRRMKRLQQTSKEVRECNQVVRLANQKWKIVLSLLDSSTGLRLFPRAAVS